MAYSYSYEDSVEFEKPIDSVWQRISDTNRLHELSGADTYTATEVVQTDKSIIRYCYGFLAKAELGKVKHVWTERFGEWKAPYFLRQRRDFTRPVQGTILLELKLTSTAKGCIVWGKLTFQGDKLLGRVLGMLGIFKLISKQRWKALIDLVNVKDIPEKTHTWKPPIYTEEQLLKVSQLVHSIDDADFGHHLGSKLANVAMNAFAIDASSIKPIELADKWKIPPEYAIEACMQALSVGLFDMRWEVLCPQCRVSKSQSTSLHEIPKNVHCESCNIEFGPDFNKNVEMTFMPACWLRPIKEATYCMLSAQRTPQNIIQLRIQPNQSEVIERTIPAGNYRCRSLEDKFSLDFTIPPDAKAFPVIELTDNGMRMIDEKKENIVLVNHSELTRYFIVEDLSYRAKALTGEKVLSMHVFRQLCPEQLIKPGDNIGISNLTILFTDLKDSTAFYYKIGEANAYKIVREHFAFLSEIISRHKGSIVKTIGDSVMAVFYEPQDALLACLDIRENLDSFNKTYHTDIQIKLGMHQQSCIAVNLNNCMDYFGSSINITARIHSLSDGDDIIVSESAAANPSVIKIMENLSITKHAEVVKGVPDPVHFYRVKKS